MKATKYLSLAALALMGTLVSCQNDDEPANSFARPANAVGINVTVGAMQTTRSNPAATDPDEAHLFNQGDQVCVSTDGQDPVLFQCTNADQQTWAEAVSGKFLLWTQNEMTFKAYYPATEGTSMTAFTLPADQSSTEKIALADYMTRQKTCNNENGTDITLDLERKTARVIVRINGFTDQYDNDEKTVSNVRINSQFSAIADGNGNGDITAVTPYMQGTGGQGTSYTALVVPGYDDSGATFITLTDGESNTLIVKGIPELEAGNSYTYNLTVGKNTIQVQSVTVQDWATGATLAGGQAQEKATSLIVNPSFGQIIGSDGKNYAANATLPDGVTKVAMIAYVGSDNGEAAPYNHGLAFSMTDAGPAKWSTSLGATIHTYLPMSENFSSESGLQYNNDTHNSDIYPAFKSAMTNNGTAVPTGCSAWFLPTGYQWKQIISAAGNYNNLRNGFTAVGGTNMSGFYWSSSERNINDAWFLSMNSGNWSSGSKTPTSISINVRACIAF